MTNSAQCRHRKPWSCTTGCAAASRSSSPRLFLYRFLHPRQHRRIVRWRDNFQAAARQTGGLPQGPWRSWASLTAVQPQRAAAAPALPYQAPGPEWALWEGSHADCSVGRLRVEVAGAGQASRLGSCAVIRQHCFNLATFGIEDGCFEQTAANGDKLWGTYTGYTGAVLEFAPGGSPVVIVIASPTQITGGTGRFAHPQGTGTMRGVFNVVTKTGTFTFDGQMTCQTPGGAVRQAGRGPTR